MEAVTRIKEFLKVQLKSGKISKSDLLKLQPDHLMKINQLKGIDRKTVSETLQFIKNKVNPESVKDEIQGLFENKNNPLADQIKNIMNG